MLFHFNWSKFFRVFLCSTIKVAENIYFVKIFFHWYGADQFKAEADLRQLQELRLTANGSQPLTIVIKNFTLDATVVLDPPLPKLRHERRIKAVRDSVPIKRCILGVLAV